MNTKHLTLKPIPEHCKRPNGCIRLHVDENSNTELICLGCDNNKKKTKADKDMLLALNKMGIVG